ncbi:hypothetical protein LRS37_11840 [Neobacillus sedimentimangrovi]|jgi:hypothetical protein|uniref:DUF4025 domain-containing protein n=1 Tax=Neobacillus sedimentimangrovi TaxID=2699460 RepID=A0ABS8QJW2_9BACI|nr:hypothetical protein [Neobacillus sedimentimangrovi]MCD4839561.1 hypothetical protein [Neobacillus sedimentimangrovi]
MQKRQQTNKTLSANSIMQPDFAGTDAQKVKQEIQHDVSAGQGAITSREAGALRKND